MEKTNKKNSSKEILNTTTKYKKDRPDATIKNLDKITEFSKKPWVIKLQLIGTCIAIVIGILTIYKYLTSGPQIFISAPAENSTILELLNDSRFKTLITLPISIVNDGDKPLYPTKFKITYSDDYNTFDCYAGEYDTAKFKGNNSLATLSFEYGDYNAHNLNKTSIVPPQSRVNGFLFCYAPEIFDNLIGSKSNKYTIIITDIKNKEYKQNVFVGPYTDQPHKLTYPQFDMKASPIK